MTHPVMINDATRELHTLILGATLGQAALSRLNAPGLATYFRALAESMEATAGVIGDDSDALAGMLRVELRYYMAMA